MAGLADDLRRALDGDELFLVYQPKVALSSGRWTGVEALLRWRHAGRGMVPPNLFIPVAEASGLMRPLTARVLDMALAQGAAWSRAGLDVPIAVNLSARDIEGHAVQGLLGAVENAHVATGEDRILDRRVTHGARGHAAVQGLGGVLAAARLQIQAALGEPAVAVRPSGCVGIGAPRLMHGGTSG